MTDTSNGPLEPGSRSLEFSLPSTSSQTIDLVHYLDKVRVALVFLGDHAHPGAAVEALDRSLAEFGSRRVQLLIVASGPMAEAKALLPPRGRVPILSDGDGAITRSYDAVGGVGDVCAVLVDEGGLVQQVLTIVGDDPAADLLSALDETAAKPA